MAIKSSSIKIGMVGLGTVGSGVLKILSAHQHLLSDRIGAKVEIKRIAVRSLQKRRMVKIPRGILTTQISEILEDPEIRIVVELMGGVREARTLALRTIEAGKHFVTANKALLATHGKEIFEKAALAQVDVCFEAAVGGGIPILRGLREGFAANQIESIFGIVNGTCNFILSEMADRRAAFAEILKRAQQLGYAEADPSFDVDGIDAAHKLVLLINIAYGVSLELKDVYIEGIRHITAYDLECAHRFGFAVKLLAIAKLNQGRIQARVHPTMIPKGSMLAAVHGVHNAIRVDGDFVGEAMLYGRGAGSEPTASAVVGDIVEVARNVISGVAYTVPPLGIFKTPVPKAKLESMGELRSSYYLRFQATDRPGVLAKIASILGKHSISISSVYQNVREEGKEVPIVILTHEALERDVRHAMAKIDLLKEIRSKSFLIRMEENCHSEVRG